MGQPCARCSRSASLDFPDPEGPARTITRAVMGIKSAAALAICGIVPRAGAGCGTLGGVERATDDVAPRVTGFEVLARVGADPSGPVLRAREIATGQVVALRRMSRAEGASVASRLADLVHLEEEHVVAVRGLVREPSAAYLVTEWVEAATLAEVMGSGERMVVGQMLGIVRSVLLGLAHVHEHGLAHGGVGPTRVLLDSDGRARLMDTGVAADASPAGDVRDAAALLVLLLTGQPVPPGTAVDKRRLRRVDAALRPVLLRALAVDPAERPPDAAALLAGLGKAARRAYGASWWTEAGLAAVVGPALPRLVPLTPSPAEEPAPPGRTRRRVRRVAATVAALAVVAGAITAAVLLLHEDPAPEPVSFRTDLFCGELDDAATAVAGSDATSRADSSGARGAEGASGGRATVSCYWGGGASGVVVSVTVGARGDVDSAGTASAERTAALLDGANQRVLAAAKGRWQPSYGTRCTALPTPGYDTAFSCLEPVMPLPRRAADPGSVRVVGVATARDQALVCGGNRRLTTSAEAAGSAALADRIADLCRAVLVRVRRGG